MDLRSALLCATAVLLVAAPARADVPGAVTTALGDKYKMNCTAIMSGADKDLDAAFAVMAPDFTNTDLQGKTQSRDEVISNAKMQMKTFHASKCDTTIDSATQPDANTIVANTSQKVVGTIQAPDGNHDLDALSKSQDTWKLANGQWMLESSKDLRELVKVDGKVVQDNGQ